MSNEKRVVITGMGIVSSIGNNVEEVKKSLVNQKSGIVKADTYKEMGFRSQIHGAVKLKLEDHVDKKQLRFMGAGAAYSVLSMEQAIKDSGLSPEEVSNPKTGLIAGSGGPSTVNLLQSFDVAREKGPKRVGPFMVPRCMSSSVSACIATFFKIKGVNFSITSACSTSAHCIGIGADQIKYGNQNIVFAGGGEELDWTLSVLFDAMGAMSSKYNETPELASRPYDLDRDGFVIAGGGGMLVLEELEHAKARGAKIYGEIAGHCANSDGHDMVAPSGEGAERSMRLALGNVEKVDYINTHGTSTPVGDVVEINAIKNVFSSGNYGEMPLITSTKSLSGHALGAAGVNEAIYSLIMMKNDFIAASANVDNLDENIKGVPIVTKLMEGKKIQTVMSNSFGFGGTNATLLFSKI